MKKQCSIPRILLGAFVCCGALWCLPSVANTNSSGAFSVGKMTGVFTIMDFKTVNGISQAAGYLTGHVTDSAGDTQVGGFTNMAVRVPLSGVLGGGPIEVEPLVHDPAILPELSTNTCALLGLAIGAIDITIPGLGLNLHVNEISIIVRADRETTVGDLLCTLLGDDLLGGPALTSGATPQASLGGRSFAQAGSTNNALTLKQVQGLMGILFEPPISGSLASKGTSTSAKSAAPKESSPQLGLLQHLLQRAIVTMQPTKSGAPSTTNQASSLNIKSPAPPKASPTANTR